jgi:hypothetical protein
MKESKIMALITIAIIFIFLCYKWGDWKNWKLYYSTIIYSFVGVLTENIIRDEKKLWVIHGSFWNDTTTDYFISCFIFPCIIILFLSNYPKGIIRQIRYLLVFQLCLSSLEYIAYINKGIFYYNGWSFIWSVFLYIGMFPLFRLHYKHPLLGWLVLFTLIGGGMFYFNIPLSNFE